MVRSITFTVGFLLANGVRNELSKYQLTSELRFHEHNQFLQSEFTLAVPEEDYNEVVFWLQRLQREHG
jgi:hypothetical protein